MKISVRQIGVMIFLGCFCMNFWGCAKNKQKGYVLQQNELAVLNNVLKDEVRVFFAGGDAFIGDGVLAVSAVDVAVEYEKNQVAADIKYFKKTLLVTGYVTSINSGLGNEPYVMLRGINEFSSPQIHFDKKVNANQVALLEKGQKISFVCNGGGAIIGTPMFKNCVFADDYAETKVAETKSQVIDFLSGKDIDSKNSKAIAIAVIALARVLPESSTCFTDGSNCSTELSGIMGSEVLKKEMNTVAEELSVLGLHVSKTNK